MKLDEDLLFQIFSVVEEIPFGKVATYGQIASLIGFPKHARLVGKALSLSEFYGSYPCHRVVNHQGRLVPGWDRQKDLLKKENISVNNNRVDLKLYQWNLY